MPKRKINRVGISTLTVSLPNKWAKTYGLRQGIEVDVIEDGPKLVVYSDGIIDLPKKIIIHLKKGQNFMRRYLNVMYRDGYDEIEITSEEPLNQTDFKYIKRGAAELLGFEVIELQPKRAVARNVATPNESEFENIFRRLFLLNITMSKTILEDMQAGCYSHTNDLAELEGTTNKFCHFCHRVLVKKDFKNRVMTLNMFRFAAELEQIADNLKRVCYVLVRQKKNLSKQVVDVFRDFTDLLHQVYTVFYQVDQTKLTELKKVRDRVYDEVYALFHKNITGHEIEISALLLSNMNCIKTLESEMYHL